MNRQRLSLCGGHDDDLEKVACRVGADEQPPVRVLASVLICQCMVDCVKDVLIRDAVPARRVVNLHTDYRTTKNALGGLLQTNSADAGENRIRRIAPRPALIGGARGSMRPVKM
jgi:hypothetical protein